MYCIDGPGRDTFRDAGRERVAISAWSFLLQDITCDMHEAKFCLTLYRKIQMGDMTHSANTTKSRSHPSDCVEYKIQNAAPRTRV